MSPFEDVPACGNGAAQPGGCGSGRRPRLRCRPWVRPGFGGFLGLASRVLLCMTIPLGRSFPSRPSFLLYLVLFHSILFLIFTPFGSMLNFYYLYGRAKSSLPGFKVLPLRQFGTWGPVMTDEFNPQKDTYVLVNSFPCLKH